MRFSKTLLLAIALGALLLTAVGCKKKEPAQILNEAIESAKRGDIYGASQKCESIIQANPQSFESYQARFILANCLVQSQDMEGARAKWVEVFTNTPLQSEVAQNSYMNNLQSYVMEKKFAEALAVIDKTSTTLATEPNFANYIHEYKINLLIENKQTQDAEKLILADIDATTSETIRSFKKNKLADFYVQVTKDYDKALQILTAQRAATTDEKEIQALVRQITGALGLQKKYDAAIAVFQQRVETAKSEEDKSASLWGVAMMQRTKADNAPDEKTKAELKKVSDKTYQDCIDQARKSMDAEILNTQKLPHLQRISLLYQEMGETQKAVETLSDYLDKNKEDKIAWATLGQQVAKIYFNQKDFVNGKAWLKKTADALPNTQEGMQALGAIAQVEKYEQALAAQAATSGTLENKATSGTQTVAPTAATK